jgi:hypothetical protein
MLRGFACAARRRDDAYSWRLGGAATQLRAERRRRWTANFCRTPLRRRVRPARSAVHHPPRPRPRAADLATGQLELLGTLADTVRGLEVDRDGRPTRRTAPPAGSTSWIRRAARRSAASPSGTRASPSLTAWGSPATAARARRRSAVQPGESGRVQRWFRDQNPGPTSNFTSGCRVLFQWVPGPATLCAPRVPPGSKRTP